MIDPTLTPDQLDELERLHTEGTPGPWRYVPAGESDALDLCEANHILGPAGCVRRFTGNASITGDEDCYPWAPEIPDMQLIAAMRTALPGLIAAARRGLEA